jgi:hypothetical protein
MYEAGTNVNFITLWDTERDLDKRREEALVVVSLSTATLIVCFSIALAML